MIHRLQIYSYISSNNKKITILPKNKIKDKLPVVLVLAWNFFEDIKKNNKNLSKKFINIKDLEN